MAKGQEGSRGMDCRLEKVTNIQGIRSSGSYSSFVVSRVRIELSQFSMAGARWRHPPDDIADVISHEKRACLIDRPPTGRPIASPP